MRLRPTLILLAMGVVLALATASASAAPPNDNFDSPVVIGTLPYSASYSTSDATLQIGEPQPCGESSKTVWFAFTAPATGPYQIDAFGSDYDTILAVYTGASLNALSVIDCGDDTPGGTQARIQLEATAGTVYRIQAGGYLGAGGALRLNVSAAPPPPANDHFAAAISVGVLPFTDTRLTAQATTDVGEPDPTCWDVDKTVWYAFTPSATGMYEVDTAESDFDTVLAVYAGSALAGLSEVACNDDIAVTTDVQSRVVVHLTGGTAYHIQAGGIEFNRFGLNVSDYGRMVLRVQAQSPDTDGDGCTDVEEAGSVPRFGGDRDPASPWDFFDVPAPLGTAAAPDGRPVIGPSSARNGAITLHDAAVVIAYMGRKSSNPAYFDDNNGDGTPDGQQLDRSPSTVSGELWHSGPPNGVISMQDVGVLLAQMGHTCAAAPN